MKKVFFMAVLMTATIAASAANVYTKVTTAPTDWTGTYLIVCESQNVVFNGGADTSKIDTKGGSAILTEGFSISNDTLIGSLTVDTATFTIGATGNETWPWYIQSASGLYLGHKDTADNGLSTELEMEEKCKQSLSIDAKGNLVAIPQYVNNEFALRYNNDADQLRFRYFKPDKKKAVQLYRLVTSPSGFVQTVSSKMQASKVIRNGQLVIIKDGQEYSVLGN